MNELTFNKALAVSAALLLLTPAWFGKQDEPVRYFGKTGVYGSGYDGADLKAINAAWAAFEKTPRLKKEDKRLDKYWFRIEQDETYRIVVIYPKVATDEFDINAVASHWPFGTDGKFWVHKATFDVDKSRVTPPP